jgi:hypothetical protein
LKLVPVRGRAALDGEIVAISTIEAAWHSGAHQRHFLSENRP